MTDNVKVMVGALASLTFGSVLYRLVNPAKGGSGSGSSKKVTADSYPRLEKHNNFMAECLTPAIYNKLKDKKTSTGFTLDQVIQTGVDNPGHPFIKTVGAVAGDEDSYEVFAELLDPIISKRHGGYPKDAIHPTDLDASKIVGGKFDEKYVLSTRVRTGRSIRGYRLPPASDRADRRAVEAIVKAACQSLRGDLSGKYFHLEQMSEAEQEEKINEHIMYDKPVSPLLTSSAWPVTGLMPVVSSTTRTRPSLSGSTRRITPVSSPCKRVVT
eukprot:TRINITY_DN33725_c0_g1_i2.p1 TRINITY_DN33725_c0_g1~~TRINITY_DN33725_c0_g1_i2.p1  ORF type:complete len:283 (+),score=33.06 TRINITY_DN33725_c0_g1_i2:42-851(+)